MNHVLLWAKMAVSAKKKHEGGTLLHSSFILKNYWIIITGF